MAERDPIAEATRKEGRGLRFYLLVGAALLLAIFVLQNTQEVEIEFLFTSTQTPLFLGLIIAGTLGALIGWAAPRVRRGGQRDERE